MKPAAFAYAKAQSVEHAVELLAIDGARIIAGGQSLVPALNMRLDAPKLLVDINGIAGLSEIAERDGWLEIGALVRQTMALGSPLIARHTPLLALALPHIAHPAIRNRGTLCGSIALADPAAELPACLVALRGEIVVQSANGSRSVPADEFYKGLFETSLQSNEVVTAIRIPVATPGMRFGFAELARRHGDYALVGLAAAAKREAGGRLADIRLVYFGVGDTPIRARGAEEALAQEASDPKPAVASLNGDLTPRGDIHASAPARLHMAGVLLKRVLPQLRGAA